jgi:hypothetical protein
VTLSESKQCPHPIFKVCIPAAPLTTIESTPLPSPESFVFPVAVPLDETAMKVDNATIPLTPGMTATVEIRIDSRRVIDYLLSPLAKIGGKTLRERQRGRPVRQLHLGQSAHGVGWAPALVVAVVLDGRREERQRLTRSPFRASSPHI